MEKERQKRETIRSYIASEKKKTEFCVWMAGLLLGSAALLLLVLDAATPFSLQALAYECWVHKRSGLYCPGCGGTRAFFALLRGDIMASVLYHPLVLYAGSVYVLFMIRGGLHLLSRGRAAFMKLRLGYVYFGIGITLVQFFLKNICLLVFRMAWMT